MTSTAPWRRMILHFSHIGLTDGRTFMGPFDWSPATRLWPPFRRPLPRPERCLQQESTPLRAHRGIIAVADGPAGPRNGLSGGRALPVRVPGSEDPGPLGLDRHRELEMGRGGAVLGEDRP